MAKWDLSKLEEPKTQYRLVRSLGGNDPEVTIAYFTIYELALVSMEALNDWDKVYTYKVI